MTEQEAQAEAEAWLKRLDSDSHWARSPEQRERIDREHTILSSLLAASGRNPKCEHRVALSDLCSYAETIANEPERVVAAPSDTDRDFKRIPAETRAELIHMAEGRIKDVCADSPEGVDAATLASNVVAAQEFVWMQLAAGVDLRASHPVQVEVTKARELPEGSVFIGYYYPPTFDIVPKARKLASVQLTRGRSIVHGERMEYPLDQPWERIEVLYRPAALGGGE